MLLLTLRCPDLKPIRTSEQSSYNIPMQPIPKGERSATPEPEWTIPLNDFLEPENNRQKNTYPQRINSCGETKLQGRHMILGHSSNGSADEQERRSSAKLT
ncbi:hypothetical protein Tco_1134907 [Tanacetum coccineum]|uniref:Uncharacterized protein n=1 Tax=Tanacetum coccineum TaxID=301880 RepID=A0ABQ5AN62_9ASTR